MNVYCTIFIFDFSGTTVIEICQDFPELL